MRKVALLIGSALLALALPAHAEPTGAPPPATATEATVPETMVSAPHRRFEVVVSYLPMALGTIKSRAAGTTTTGDAAFATGAGVSVSMNVFRGFTVGIAPQAIFKGKLKANPDLSYTMFGADSQYDLLLRLAYVYAIPNVVTLYAEVLPGYSMIYPATQDTSKGLVMVYGVGAQLGIWNRVFANVGVGYQMGYQKVTSAAFYRNDYVRGNLGLGLRF